MCPGLPGSVAAGSSVIQAVLFDLYGTLLVYGDMDKAWRSWISDVRDGLVALGLDICESEVHSHCEGFFSRPVEPFPGLVPYECRMRSLAIRLGCEPSVQWCKDMARRSMDDWQAEIPLDPQALTLLQGLRDRGVRCGVLTNFDYPDHVRRLLASTGLDEHLDAVVISGEVGLKKPDPQIFALALERIGCQAKDVLFVGDHPDQDIRGALQSGVRAMLVRRSGEGVLSSHVDYQLENGTGLFPVDGPRFQIDVVTSLEDIPVRLFQEHA